MSAQVKHHHPPQHYHSMGRVLECFHWGWRGTQAWTQLYMAGPCLLGDTFPPCSTCDSCHKLGQVKLEIQKQSRGKEEKRGEKTIQKKGRCKEYFFE